MSPLEIYSLAVQHVCMMRGACTQTSSGTNDTIRLTILIQSKTHQIDHFWCNNNIIAFPTFVLCDDRSRLHFYYICRFFFFFYFFLFKYWIEHLNPIRVMALRASYECCYDGACANNVVIYIFYYNVLKPFEWLKASGDSGERWTHSWCDGRCLCLCIFNNNNLSFFWLYIAKKITWIISIIHLDGSSEPLLSRFEYNMISTRVCT